MLPHSPARYGIYTLIVMAKLFIVATVFFIDEFEALQIGEY